MGGPPQTALFGSKVWTIRIIRQIPTFLASELVPRHPFRPFTLVIGFLLISAAKIIVSFVVTSLLTLGFALAYIILDNQRNARVNRIDGWCSKHLIYLTVAQKRRDFWLPVIEKVVLGLSDQQLLTGLAILIAGLCKLCSISVYHFAVVGDLAWFSSNVHVTSLGILQTYFRQKSRRIYRNWRVCLMCLMAMLMITTFVMQGHKQWNASWNSPAHCLINDLVGNVWGLPAFWLSFNLLFLLVGYGLTMLFLFKSSSEFFEEWIFTIPAMAIERKIGACQERGQRHRYSELLAKGLQLFLSVLLWIQEIVFSQCLGFVIDVAWFILGVYWIILDRNIPASSIDGNENDLTFGQIVPLFLLSSTILTLREAYDGKIQVCNAAEDQSKLTLLLDEEHKNDHLPDSSTATTHLLASVPNQDLGGSLQDHQMTKGISSSTLDRDEDSVSLHFRRVDTEGGGRAATSGVEPQQFVLNPQRRSFPL